MIRDLIALFDTVRSAQDAQEKADRLADLENAVHAEIRDLFDDIGDADRKTSFGAIKTRLAIYDNDPDALTAILFAMGARRASGTGDAALWHLPGPEAAPPDPPARPRRWQATAAVLGLGALAVLAATNLDTLRGFFGGDGFATKTDCLAAANGNMRKISECERQFP